jgi:hypothetical protein
MATSIVGDKIAVFECCPAQLAEAVVQRNLVIFCGAGTSMAPPAAVPSWAGFNEALFDQIKAQAAKLPGLSHAGAEIIDGLTVIHGATRKGAQVVPTEGFSDAVADLLLSDEYFPALQVLDGEQCNANHEALASLAKTGAVRAIVTTNFDTLIERALRNQRVEFKCVISQTDYELGSEASTAVALYKIHGSVDAPDSLRDTATQKFGGLPLYIRLRIAELFRRHHVW